MNKLLLSKLYPRRTGVRLAHDLKAADSQAYSMPECYKKKLKSSWLTSDNFVYKEYSFPPFEIPPHPRAMIEPFTSTAKLRNSPWRFIWEHNNHCRYFIYLGPIVVYFWWCLVQPVITPEWRAKDAHKEHIEHMKEEAMSAWRQKEADFKHFNWTKGDLDPVFDYEMAHRRAHH